MLNRVFKTKGFAVTAKKASISDAELCHGIHEVMQGQAVDLGGGIWKKRLNENRHRSIVLARGRSYWVYQFLFAKQDQGNISKNELAAFKRLARGYEDLGSDQIQRLVARRDFMEICVVKNFKSDAMGAVHESATALYEIGAINKATMREFDDTCIAPVPAEIEPGQIKAIRERSRVSQPVFARYLNTSTSTVKQWEAGDKRPSGMALKLLTIVQKHGLEILS